MKIPYINTDKISEQIAEGFKSLFETKHLYQNIKIDLSVFQKKKTKTGRGIGAGNFKEEFPGCITVDYALLPVRPWKLSISTRETDPLDYAVIVPPIKIFCPINERLEPFYPKDVYTISHDKLQEVITQDFTISYECKSCDTPTTFMVKREGLKLVLTGRSPMEDVQVPGYIPKKQKHYIRDAIVACNSGQILPGLFMLRVFIEQYTKSLSSAPNLMADEYVEQYMKSLTPEFNARVPSVSHIYKTLSEAIHTADASSELFVKTLEVLYLHFEAKQLEEKLQKKPSDDK